MPGEGTREILLLQGFQIKVGASKGVKSHRLCSDTCHSPLDCICQTISTSNIYSNFSKKIISSIIIFSFRKYMSIDCSHMFKLNLITY